jgi:hypothetical protein
MQVFFVDFLSSDTVLQIAYKKLVMFVWDQWTKYPGQKSCDVHYSGMEFDSLSLYLIGP